ncbi:MULTISPECIES: KH domain-containing protein [unclassified Leptolyngbya]|uniref:KH domain-containing protein n=1 Tax=unclassified Leptolyngbya TaxID=2650499 RepID=UPI001684ADC5|nr:MULTISPECIES: KH domain-containing protein [unclassified Leptolyngbya]MBD1911498.1 KH domain-containing protein [Leptolyngbya sp. FACHB-8]MBD2155261.1 KH domain-containing protein [Leptolyngbya sp. FACHB-16]
MPESPVPDVTNTASNTHPPDFERLVRFLVTPFLESPDALKVDCEVRPSRQKALIRIAFEGEEKGRVFGRGGRNIQAIRTVVEAFSQLAGYTAHLDVYGSSSANHRDGGPPRERDGGGGHSRPDRRPGPRRPPRH